MMAAVKGLQLDTTVGDASSVGKTIVLEACTQVAASHGQRASLEVAAGALSAALGIIMVTMGEAAARGIVEGALRAGVESLANGARQRAH